MTPATDPRVDFIKGLPASVQLEMIRAAARGQHVPTLNLLSQAGVFDAVRQLTADEDPFESHERMACEELPQFGCLASVLHAARTRSDPRDRVTGEVFQFNDGLYRAFELDVDPAFLAFFGDVCIRLFAEVQREIDELEKIARGRYLGPSNRHPLTRRGSMANRLRATGGVLMAIACALDDVPTLRQIIAGLKQLCEVAPGKAFFEQPVARTLWISAQVFKEEAVQVRAMHAPMRLAIEFASPGAIKVLLQEGWDREVGVLSMVHENLQPTLVQRICFLPQPDLKYMTLAAVLAKGYVRPYPGVLDQVLPSNGPEDPLFEVQAQALRSWAESLLEGRLGYPAEMIDVALRHGLYTIEPAQSFMKVCTQAPVDLIDRLAMTLDWSALSLKNNPVQAILQTGDVQSLDSVVLEERLLRVLRQCVVHGRQDLLTETHFEAIHCSLTAFHALNECARKGFHRAALVCLEVGADPHFHGDDGLDAAGCAAANEHNSLARMIVSFATRKGALSALQELEASCISPEDDVKTEYSEEHHAELQL